MVIMDRIIRILVLFGACFGAFAELSMFRLFDRFDVDGDGVWSPSDLAGM